VLEGLRRLYTKNPSTGSGVEFSSRNQKWLVERKGIGQDYYSTKQVSLPRYLFFITLCSTNNKQEKKKSIRKERNG
jgi:hypothetical protein